MMIPRQVWTAKTEKVHVIVPQLGVLNVAVHQADVRTRGVERYRLI
ncbi:hypothetical protein [uncultured Ruminococcus sp.]|nr:hypothetical protein [uncultured Ruminococcus sp.]